MEILVSAIQIVRYFCIDSGINVVFHHSIAYRFRLTVFLCIAEHKYLDIVFERDQSYQVLTAGSLTVSEECEMKLKFPLIHSDVLSANFPYHYLQLFLNDVNCEIGTCPMYVPFLRFAIVRRLQTCSSRICNNLKSSCLASARKKRKFSCLRAYGRKRSVVAEQG